MIRIERNNSVIILSYGSLKGKKGRPGGEGGEGGDEQTSCAQTEGIENAELNTLPSLQEFLQNELIDYQFAGLRGLGLPEALPRKKGERRCQTLWTSVGAALLK